MCATYLSGTIIYRWGRCCVYNDLSSIHKPMQRSVMFDLAFVTPKSNKARNRFANLMNSNPECIVEQIKENRVFLRSLNGRNFFWVDIKNDIHWAVDF